jgi:UDP-glucose 4-epimerase
MSRVKVVVTGGAGFIGSHIVERWLELGAEVHIIDNLRTGFLSNVQLFPDALFHKGSITNRDLVFKVLNGADYVHHLAAFVSVPESLEKPDECYDININGLLNVLDACAEFGIKKIVFSSSAAVYGNNPESPKRITSKTGPLSPYASTKLEGETHINRFKELHRFGAVSLRYFNVFGPRQNPQSQYAAAVPIFITNALNNRPIIIYGNGNQTRDFIFAEDVVEANIKAAASVKVDGVFNVAAGNATSILELAQIIIDETNSKSKIEFHEERAGDILHSLASIDETKIELGFEPKYSLVNGLKKTIEYYRSKTN